MIRKNSSRERSECNERSDRWRRYPSQTRVFSDSSRMGIYVLRRCNHPRPVTSLRCVPGCCSWTKPIEH